MGDSQPDVDVFECGSCGTVAFGPGEVTCCGERTESVGPRSDGVERPELGSLLRFVFGMSASELEVCLCVMETGETTTGDVADRFDVDRSTVSRHLNHLADVGALEKRRRIRKGGGRVYVFAPDSEEEVRRAFERGLYGWTGEALRQIDALSREKVESMIDRSDGDEPRIYADE